MVFGLMDPGDRDLVVTNTGLWVVLLRGAPLDCFRFFFTTSFFPFFSFITTFPILLLF